MQTPVDCRDLNLVFAGNFPFPAGDAGAQLVTHHMVHFAEQGARVCLLVLRGLPVLPGNDGLSGEYRGVPYVVIGRRMTGVSGFLVHAPAYVREGVRFLRSRLLDGRRNVLIVYGQPDPENAVFLLAAKRMGYLVLSWIVEDFAVQTEDASVRYRVKRWSLGALSRLTPRCVSGISVLSFRLQERFKTFGVPVAVIPIATEKTDPPPAVELHRPLRLLYAGSFARKDGVETLLDAFRGVRDEGAGCCLTLVGPCSAAASARLEPHGLLERDVRQTGYVSDEAFADEIRQADVLCMTRVDTPYANAGFPYKLASYLASGRPVIASTVSDIPRYLEDGVSAVLVPPEKPDAVADAIRRLRDDPLMAQAIGKAGRRVYERYFTTEVTGPRWLEFMGECARFQAAKKGLRVV